MNNKNEILELLKKSISLEKRIGQLYTLFAQYYEEDNLFWKDLAEEENKHARTLEGLQPWLNMGANLDDYILQNLNELTEKNISLKKVIQFALDEPPTREMAFNVALKIELTASELHYQKIITKHTDDKLLQSMQELCGADKDHAKRIRKMMKSLNIDHVQT